MPYIGFFWPLLILTVPLAVYSALHLGLRHIRGPLDRDAALATLPAVPARMTRRRVYLPLAVVVALMLLVRAFPHVIPPLGIPLMFLAGGAVAFAAAGARVEPDPGGARHVPRDARGERHPDRRGGARAGDGGQRRARPVRDLVHQRAGVRALRRDLRGVRVPRGRAGPVRGRLGLRHPVHARAARPRPHPGHGGAEPARLRVQRHAADGDPRQERDDPGRLPRLGTGRSCACRPRRRWRSRWSASRRSSTRTPSASCASPGDGGRRR